MNKYGLLGEKLGHSYSKIIHNLIFNHINLDASYDLIECQKDELQDKINDLKNGIYQGYNVTIPYKKEIMKYLDIITDHAKSIGSVNTVYYRNGKLIGDNTDYYGFYNELLYFDVKVKNSNCYVLGTGGASLAIYKSLVDLGGNVKYVSRNPQNDLTISYEQLKNEKIDIIVNTTPVGMYPNVGVSPIDKSITLKAKYVLDVIFNPRQTQILLDANSNMDGLYMLVGQALKAEEIWQDKNIDIDIAQLLKEVEEYI